MVVKKRAAKSADLEVVLSVAEGEDSLPRRINALLKAAAQAHLRVDVAVFCHENHAGPRTTRRIAAPCDHSSQAALLLAAAGSKAKHLIFWPKNHSPNPKLLRALVAGSKKLDWVFAPRGGAPPLAAFLEKAGALPFVLDLGAPSIISRKRLIPLAACLAPDDAFIAPRLVRAADAADFSMGLLPEGPEKLSLTEALGLDRGLIESRLKKRAKGLACGAAMVAAGILLKEAPLTGVLLFGFGILALGYFFGNAE